MTTRERPIGAMTIERERHLRLLGWRVRVLVHGVDVTRRCRFADDTPGRTYALLYRHNVRGRAHLDEDGRPAMEEAFEDVVLEVERP